MRLNQVTVLARIPILHTSALHNVEDGGMLLSVPPRSLYGHVHW